MNNDMQVDASGSGPMALDDGGWKFAQCFGEKNEVEDVSEADIISAVEFDQTGDFLATGDKGGRVVMFERNKTKKTCEYQFFTEFQSHEPEFDYLKSVEIEEKINQIKWCKRSGNHHMLLTTNDKTVKLWKVYQKSVKALVEAPLVKPALSSKPVLKIPKLIEEDQFIAAQPKRTYANAHAYHINSISTNSDGESFLSADDLRINLWNFNHINQSFNIVDIKPENMEELTHVITAAQFHPSDCNSFMYSSSNGSIKLIDMRMSALCEQHAKVFENQDGSDASFFSEILASVNDIKFSPNGRYILSRDYLTMKLWDMNMESQPVKVFDILGHVKPKLVELYEKECLFDKFECNFSGDGKGVMSGSYSNFFHIFDKDSSNEITLQADKSALRKRPGMKKTGPTRKPIKKNEIDPDTMEYNKKILHASWHPQENSLAIAATNNLFLFSTL